MPEQITADQVRMVYRAVLNREPESDAVVEGFARLPITLEQFIKDAIASQEFSNGFKPRPRVSHLAPDYLRHNDSNYLFPKDLRIDATLPPKVLLVGSCFLSFMQSVSDRLDLGYVTDLLHLNMHPEVPAPARWEDYRYQIGQIPLRWVLPDASYFEWIRNGFSDLATAERIFQKACDALDFFIKKCTVWSDKLPIFMMNFLSPVQNVNGRLLSGFDLRDNRYFVQELNRVFAQRVEKLPNVYMLDVDACAANMGRRFFQEDALWVNNHGGLIGDADYSNDTDRIIKQLPVSAHYRLEQAEFISVVLSEADLAWRSLRGIGSVKMVCVDLDDTLWRGVLAESDYIDPEQAVGGWPLGVLEALAVLKRRGILLCILSKNDEQTVRNIWKQLYERNFPLDEFAIKKINWNSKAENIREAIAEANIMPNSVVFLDDNPVERNAVASAFPEVRVIESSHYYWKRILLWSAETQGAVITDESMRRTEMVKAQIEREAARTTVSRDEFLRDLDLQVVFTKVEGRDNPRFPRVVELINKTNQFNTTGRRWTAEEIEDVCRRGIVLATDVSDRFSHYGIVAVALFLDGVLEQIVMSCRVVGMEVELATMSMMTGMALRTTPVIRARTIETRANLLSRDLFQKCGWTIIDDVWRTGEANPMPIHMRIEEPALTP